MLDAEGLQIYAFSLWKLGQSNLVLSEAKNLAASVSCMERISAAASVILICRLLYYISGLDSAVNSILKMPKELFQSSKISFIVSAIHALDRSNRLESVVSSSRYFLKSPEHISGMHFLIALGKLVSLLFTLIWELILVDLMRILIWYCYCIFVCLLCRWKMGWDLLLDFRVEWLTLEKLFTCIPTVVC